MPLCTVIYYHIFISYHIKFQSLSYHYSTLPILDTMPKKILAGESIDIPITIIGYNIILGLKGS